MTSRDEIGQQFADTDGFVVQIIIHRFSDFYFRYFACFIYDKIHYDSALGIYFGSLGRIFDIYLEEQHQCLLSSWKHRRLEIIGHIGTFIHRERPHLIEQLEGHWYRVQHVNGFPILLAGMEVYLT